jgi:hypothetical protein
LVAFLFFTLKLFVCRVNRGRPIGVVERCEATHGRENGRAMLVEKVKNNN